MISNHFVMVLICTTFTQDSVSVPATMVEYYSLSGFYTTEGIPLIERQGSLN